MKLNWSSNPITHKKRKDKETNAERCYPDQYVDNESHNTTKTVQTSS